MIVVLVTFRRNNRGEARREAGQLHSRIRISERLVVQKLEGQATSDFICPTNLFCVHCSESDSGQRFSAAFCLLNRVVG